MLLSLVLSVVTAFMEIVVICSDGGDFELPQSMIEKSSVLLHKLAQRKTLQDPILLDSMDSTQFQYVLTFLDMYDSENNSFEYDPIFLSEMKLAAENLQVDIMINFCEQEQQRFQKARQRIISWEEFCNHQKRESFWILIDQGIYDVTEWINYYPNTKQCPHPGSTTPLQGYKKDSTYFFEVYHATNDCYTLMKKFFIGVLDPADTNQVPPLSHAASSEFYETLRSFSCAWMSNDEHGQQCHK